MYYIDRLCNGSMLNKRYSTLPKVNCRPFASEVVFWAILKYFWVLCLLFLLIEGQGWNQIFWTVPGPERFSLENCNVPLLKLAAERLKDSRFFSYLPTRNPSKRPGASPRGKSKSRSFRTVKMRSEIYTCQPQNRLADCIFLIGYR